MNGIETHETDMNTIRQTQCVMYHGKYLINEVPTPIVPLSLCLPWAHCLSDHGVRVLDVLTLYREPGYYHFYLKATARQGKRGPHLSRPKGLSSG